MESYLLNAAQKKIAAYTRSQDDQAFGAWWALDKKKPQYRFDHNGWGGNHLPPRLLALSVA